MGNYTAKNRNSNDDGNSNDTVKSQLKKEAAGKIGEAALEGMGVPKPLAKMAVNQAQNGNLNIPGMGTNPLQPKNSGQGFNNKSSKQKESEDAKNSKNDKNKDDGDDKGNNKDNNDSDKRKIGSKSNFKPSFSSKSSAEGDGELDGQIKMTIVRSIIGGLLGGSALFPLLMIFLTLVIISSIIISYNGESNLFKVGEAYAAENSNSPVSSITPEGDGEATGYLKCPLGPNDTNSDARDKVGSNSQTLYYASGGYHGAIDFDVPSGTTVYAMDGGTVYKTGYDGDGYGNYIILKHEFTQGTYYTLYAHLTSISISSNQNISQGQQIGISGNTGNVRGNGDGSHLHAELINSVSCLGKSCRGVHYNILNYIGENKTYVGQKCDGKGC